MLRSIGNLLGKIGAQPDESQAGREHAVQLATALLLIEVARADFAEDLTEDKAVFSLLKGFFDLSNAEAAILIDRARAEADHSASLQAFTRQLHEELSRKEKHRIIEMLWQVAMADDHLDKHEDHLVRKVAALLYVSHSDLIRIRNRVKKI